MPNRRAAAICGASIPTSIICCSFLGTAVEILSTCCITDGFAAISRRQTEFSSQRLQTISHNNNMIENALCFIH